MTRRAQSATAPLADRLLDRIESHGPIPFSEFMDAALYDPYEGFFSRNRIGERGDFVTGPHLSGAFATLLARQIRDFWDALGHPDHFFIIEVGAGDGTLARQLTASISGPLKDVMRYVAIERSEAGRDALDQLGVASAPSLGHVGPVDAGCVVANELLDNLPFHWMRQTPDGLVELHVGARHGAFVLLEAPPSSAELAGNTPPLSAGQEALVRPDALRFIDDAARVVPRGYIWLADYASEPADETPSVHGYRSHRILDDVLSEPGSRDITAGVDFEALVRHAGSRGLATWGPVSQREALYSLGYASWDAAQRRRQVDALGSGRGLEAARIYSERNRAAVLVDPDRLGGFKVLCLGVGVDLPPVCVGGGERRDESAVDVSDDEEDAAEDGDEVGHERAGEQGGQDGDVVE